MYKALRFMQSGELWLCSQHQKLRRSQHFEAHLYCPQLFSCVTELSLFLVTASHSHGKILRDGSVHSGHFPYLHWPTNQTRDVYWGWPTGFWWPFLPSLSQEPPPGLTHAVLFPGCHACDFDPSFWAMTCTR